MARGATTDAPTTTRGNEDENDEETELVVLDFDLTVLSIHSFATRVRAEDVRDGTRDWKKDFVDLNHLKGFYGACVVTRWMNECMNECALVAKRRGASTPRLTEISPLFRRRE